jgi:hypothetical protein
LFVFPYQYLEEGKSKKKKKKKKVVTVCSGVIIKSILNEVVFLYSATSVPKYIQIQMKGPFLPKN